MKNAIDDNLPAATDYDSQDYYMKNELCFHVDEQDNILDTLTKYESHRLNPATSKAPLHRAFSVFLINPDTQELLLQQRSDLKITFPLLWANSCCSHPIAGLQEDTADIITGVAKAARRKLHHELGIPVTITEKRTFYHCGRIHYHANQDPWGEHEIDHILIMFADTELIESIALNNREVKAIKFVTMKDLKSLDSAALTPWFQKIVSTDLLPTWIETIKAMAANDAPLVETKFTNNKINL